LVGHCLLLRRAIASIDLVQHLCIRFLDRSILSGHDLRGLQVTPLFAGLLGVGGAASHSLLELGRVGVAVGLGLSLVSGLAYTASWIRIYEAAGSETR
jgi:hypothetical protein